MAVVCAALLVALQAYALVYLAYLWLPALAALRAARRKWPELEIVPRKERSFAILVSAHNEEVVIGALLWSLALQQYPAGKRKVYVVANNCTDSTATIVRSTRFAVCLERSDGHLATKGAALAWLWERVAGEAWGCDCVLILDADNLVAPDFLQEMNWLFDRGFPVVQSARCAKNAGDSWASQLDAISEALWNRLDQAGRMELGWPATTAGSGTAFECSIFRWLVAGGVRGLCEDIEWQARLMREGIRVGYASKAKVYDEKTRKAGQLGRQRRRWVAGVALTARHYGLPLLASGLRSGDVRRLVAGFAATKPPRSLLLTLMGLMALGEALFPGVPGLLPWLFWAAALAVFGAYVLAGMALDHAGPRAYVALAFAPAFVALMLVAAVAGALRASKQQWVPTAHERGVTIDQLHER